MPQTLNEDYKPELRRTVSCPNLAQQSKKSKKLSEKHYQLLTEQLQKQINDQNYEIKKLKNQTRSLEIKTGIILERQSILVTPKNEVEKVKLEKISQYLKEYEDCFLLPEKQRNITCLQVLRKILAKPLSQILLINGSFTSSEMENRENLEQELEKYVNDTSRNFYKDENGKTHSTMFGLFIKNLRDRDNEENTIDILKILEILEENKIIQWKTADFLLCKETPKEVQKQAQEFILGLFLLYAKGNMMLLLDMCDNSDSYTLKSLKVAKLISNLHNLKYNVYHHLFNKSIKNIFDIDVVKLQNVYCLNPCFAHCKGIPILNCENVKRIYSYEELCDFATGKNDIGYFIQ